MLNPKNLLANIYNYNITVTCTVWSYLKPADNHAVIITCMQNDPRLQYDSIRGINCGEPFSCAGVALLVGQVRLTILLFFK